jgi:hypothetical protein
MILVRDVFQLKVGKAKDAKALWKEAADPWSQSLAEGWRTGVAKALERQLASMVPG